MCLHGTSWSRRSTHSTLARMSGPLSRPLSMPPKVPALHRRDCRGACFIVIPFGTHDSLSLLVAHDHYPLSSNIGRQSARGHHRITGQRRVNSRAQLFALAYGRHLWRHFPRVRLRCRCASCARGGGVGLQHCKAAVSSRRIVGTLLFRVSPKRGK